MKRIVILAGETFRQIHYCEDTPVDVSEGFAEFAVDKGLARLPTEEEIARWKEKGDRS